MPVSTRSRAPPRVVAGHASTSPTPSADERAYRDLTRQREDLHRRICQKNHARAQLERGILRFYYEHSICCEKELSAILCSSAARASDSAVKGPSQGGSEVSRRMRELRIQEERQAKELAEYEAAIALMEEEYERTIIHGMLAAEQEAVNLSQSQLRELKGELERQRQIDKDLVFLTENLERELQDVRKEKGNSELRKTVLEEKKRYQMENLGNTRRELQQAHSDASQAQKELERREAVNKKLQSQIEEHSLRLKRRKLN